LVSNSQLRIWIKPFSQVIALVVAVAGAASVVSAAVWDSLAELEPVE
jgi:hypothetical protein